MCTRTSTRWFDVGAHKKAFTPIPFVHISGHLSGSTLCFWTAYPQQVLASLSSTVYQRLLRIVSRRHGWKYSRGCRETLFKIASYYTVTRDDGFLNRILGIFKKRNRRAAHNLYVYAFSNLDEDIRFVISQICQQILWLTFRSRTVVRQERRDKSFVDDLFPEAPSPLGVDGSGYQNDLFLWRKASQAWKTLHEYRWTQRLTSLSGSSEFDVYLSETPDEFL